MKRCSAAFSWSFGMECVLHAANMKQPYLINILTQVCFLVQYQTRVSLMLNIWCFCKTFARPSTGDCQHQPCFLPEFPPRHQIISVGALSSFIWLAFKNLIKLDSKNNTTLDVHGIGLDMSDHFYNWKNDQYQLHFGMCCDVKNVFKFNVVIFYDQM